MNDYIPTTLVSEGVLVQQYGWEFITTMKGKLARHPGGEFWAQQQATLFYLPDDMVGADAATQHTCVSAGGIPTEVVKDTRDSDSAQHERDAHRPTANTHQ